MENNNYRSIFVLFSFFKIASEQNDDSLHEEINKAHVVCIVYSVEDESSMDRISEHWLPLIRDSVNESEQRKPVVLVGNKIDLIDYSTIDVSGKYFMISICYYFSFILFTKYLHVNLFIYLNFRTFSV